MAVSKVRTGVILISIGVLLLLNTTGMVDFGFWGWIAKLWPVILIAIGIEKLFSSAQSSSLRNLAWLSPVIIVAVVAYSVVAGERDDNSNKWGSNWQWNWDDNSNAPTSTHTWSESFDSDAKRLDLNLEMSGGRLTVRGGTDSGNLVMARASSRGDKPSSTKSAVGDGVYQVSIHQRDHSDHLGRDQWIIKVTDSIPVDMKIEGGAARMRLDLSAVKIENLELDAGAADVDIVLGSMVPNVKCDLECGAAALDITIPSVAGLRLYRDGVISRLSDNNLNLVDRGSFSESEGYSDSQVKIEMRVTSALTSLRLRRASGPASPESI